MTEETCENCKFYMNGECHIYPPQISTMMLRRIVSDRFEDELIAKAFFPDVSPDNWCGEFRKKEIQKENERQ